MHLTAAHEPALLHLPPAAQGRLGPTSYARRSHNPEVAETKPTAITKENPIHMDGVFFGS